MAHLRRFLLRLLNVVRSGDAEPELAREIASHLRLLEDDCERRGMTPEEARLAARRAFGGVEHAKDLHRDARSFTWLDDARRDFQHAARLLRRDPLFTLTAALSLALGIGATTAIFSVADASLLNPLPFPDPDRLVTVNEIVPLIAQRPIRLTAPDLVDYQEQTRSFAALGGWTPRPFELSGSRESERVQGVRATASLFSALQVPPALGRAFTDDEDRNGVTVCLISNGLWQRRFGADPGVLGQIVDLDRVPYRVIGVMPRRFEFPMRGTDTPFATDIWVPMSLTPNERQARADFWNYNGVARLKRGVTAARASADVNAVAQHIVSDLMPADRAGFITFTALVRPMGEQIAGPVRSLVLVLAGAVACVLLIACVNVSNLLLARGAHRERELAVRSALGASRGRILRQLVTETLLIGTLAAAAGGVLAWWTTDALSRFIPTRFAALAHAEFNWHVVMFTAGIAIASAALAGLLPGLAVTGGGRVETIRERGAAALGVHHRRLRSALTVAEIALALVLLVGAGLLARTFRGLLNTSPGFQPEGAVAGFISLPEHEYPDAARERQFYRELLDRLHGLPNTELAGLGATLPLTGRRSERTFVPDEYAPPPNARFNIAGMTVVAGEYLQAIGATLVRGRYFRQQDDDKAQPVAIVTQALAGHFWPGKDAIGKRLKWGIQQSPSPWLTVVGVVADVKQDSLDAPAAFQVYVPADQVERSIVAELRREFTVNELRSMFAVVRGRGQSDALAEALRTTVRGIDSRLAVARLQPLTKTVSTSAAPQRFNMLLMSGFAGVALLLAAVGIYGVVTYSVVQRTQEIGVRMALGANAGSVVRFFVLEGMRLAAIGVLLGTAAAAALAPALTSLLFGVKPLDLPTFASVALLLFATAGLATYMPARRATKVDPLLALRCE